MKTSIFFSTLLIASSLSISQAQTTNSPIVDEDGILNIVDKPFDVNRFVIGRDFHENKFSDQNKVWQTVILICRTLQMGPNKTLNFARN